MAVPWRLPTPFRDEARRRAWLLLGEATAPMLDLGGDVSPVATAQWRAQQAVTTIVARGPDPTLELETMSAEGRAGTFAVISSVVVTPYVADLPRLFRAVADLLDIDGRFLFVEPDSTSRASTHLAKSALNSVSGLELGRDTTGAMWDSGLSVARIDRQPVARSVWPFRSLVSGVARLAPSDDTRSRRS